MRERTLDEVLRLLVRVPKEPRVALVDAPAALEELLAAEHLLDVVPVRSGLRRRLRGARTAAGLNGLEELVLGWRNWCWLRWAGARAGGRQQGACERA